MLCLTTADEVKQANCCETGPLQYDLRDKGMTKADENLEVVALSAWPASNRTARTGKNKAKGCCDVRESNSSQMLGRHLC